VGCGGKATLGPTQDASGLTPAAGIAKPAAGVDFQQLSAEAYEFNRPALGASSASSELQANITNIPIQIWVTRSDEGAIQRIVVTGHATEAVCRQASLLLLELVSNAKVVSGYLGYGVGELYPASDKAAQPFDQAAKELLSKLTTIDQEDPGYIELHFAQAQAVSAATPPEEFGVVAIVKHQSRRAGPAFIPVRRWSTDGTVAPVQLDFRNADFPEVARMVKRLGPEVATGPLAEAVDAQRDVIQRLQRLKSWKVTGKPFNDGVVAFTEQWSFGVPAEEQLTASTELMIRFVRKYDAIALLRPTTSSRFSSEIHAQVRQIEHAIAANTICSYVGGQGRPCNHVMALEKPPQDESGRRTAASVSAMMKEVEEATLENFDEALAHARQNLDEMQRHLALARSSPHRLAAGSRETALDGALRGWPMSVGDEKLADQVDELERRDVPSAFDQLLSSYRGNSGVDLSQDGRVAGVLERTNLFYRVREVSPSQYSVTPTYVVLGDYLEVWDPNNHRVTIEVAEGDTGDADIRN